METIYEPVSDIANPGEDINSPSTQSASADNTPAETPHSPSAEGLHFDFSSDSATPPTEETAERPSAPEAYLPVYNGETVRVDAADTEEVL